MVGQDGETHQGVLDLSFFSIVPNLVVMAPKNFKELRQMLDFAVNINKPCVIRYPRGGEDEKVIFEDNEKIELGKAQIIEQGRDITILAIGKMVARARKVAECLKENGISCEVINVRFLKPFDKKLIKDSIEKTRNVITIEDNVLEGGLATKVKELIVENNIKINNIHCFGYPDEFIKHGKVDELEKKYRLDEDDIEKTILQALGKI